MLLLHRSYLRIVSGECIWNDYRQQISIFIKLQIRKIKFFVLLHWGKIRFIKILPLQYIMFITINYRIGIIFRVCVFLAHLSLYILHIDSDSKKQFIISRILLSSIDNIKKENWQNNYFHILFWRNFEIVKD